MIDDFHSLSKYPTPNSLYPLFVFIQTLQPGHRQRFGGNDGDDDGRGRRCRCRCSVGDARQRRCEPLSRVARGPDAPVVQRWTFNHIALCSYRLISVCVVRRGRWTEEIEMDCVQRGDSHTTHTQHNRKQTQTQTDAVEVWRKIGSTRMACTIFIIFRLSFVY